MGLDNINLQFDRDGRSILDTTSALINAHVDAAKYNYIGFLNVNQYTYSPVSFMITTGVGTNTFLFLLQPILKSLVHNYNTINNAEVGTT